MSKKTIAIDIDDVIADSTDALRLVVNETSGVELTREQYNVEGEYWRYYETVWAYHKIDHLVSFDGLSDNMAVGQDHVKVINDASLAIAELHKKYKIVAVTSRTVKWIDKTKEWITKNFPEVFDDIVFVHHDDNDGRTKGDACVEAGATWLIDDNYEHCNSAVDRSVTALLFGDYGWNRKFHKAQMIHHVKNWREVLEYFDEQD